MTDFDSQVAAVTGGEPAPKKAPPPLPPKKIPPPLPPKKPAVDSLGFSTTADSSFDTGTGLPLVEAGTINPPESAGKAPSATPEELAASQGIVKPEPVVDGLEKLELSELKAIALAEGVAIAPRLRTKTIIELIRAHRAAGGSTASTEEPEFQHPKDPPPGSAAYEDEEDDKSDARARLLEKLGPVSDEALQEIREELYAERSVASEPEADREAEFDAQESLVERVAVKFEDTKIEGFDQSEVEELSSNNDAAIVRAFLACQEAANLLGMKISIVFEPVSK